MEHKNLFELMNRAIYETNHKMIDRIEMNEPCLKMFIECFQTGQNPETRFYGFSLNVPVILGKDSCGIEFKSKTGETLAKIAHNPNVSCR
jgi:hypothetical protein